MPRDGGYPVLTLGFDEYAPPVLSGTGTAADPYQIATAEDLGTVWRQDPSACYQMTSHIDLAGISWVNAPIPGFNGTFDGAGFTISHLTVHKGNEAGLFASLGPDAIVLNLGVMDVNITGGAGARRLGSLAGLNDRGAIIGCYATGRVSGGFRSLDLGGLIGRNYGSITDCYAITDVSCDPKSSRAGGLLGWSTGVILRLRCGRSPDSCGSERYMRRSRGSAGEATIGNCVLIWVCLAAVGQRAGGSPD